MSSRLLGSGRVRTRSLSRRLVDLEPVERLLAELKERYDVRRLFSTRTRCGSTRTLWPALTVDEIRSGSPEQKEGSRTLYSMIQAGEIVHDGGEALTDHVLGTRAVWDSHQRLSVYRRRQERKIDGWYATVNALARMPEQESIYRGCGIFAIDSGAERPPLEERDIAGFYDPGTKVADDHGSDLGPAQVLLQRLPVTREDERGDQAGGGELAGAPRRVGARPADTRSRCRDTALHRPLWPRRNDGRAQHRCLDRHEPDRDRNLEEHDEQH